jgi:hypothetical protein
MGAFQTVCSHTVRHTHRVARERPKAAEQCVLIQSFGRGTQACMGSTNWHTTADTTPINIVNRYSRAVSHPA